MHDFLTTLSNLSGTAPLLGGVVSFLGTAILYFARKGIFGYFRPIAIVCIERDDAIARADEATERAEAAEARATNWESNSRALEGRVARMEKRVQALVSYADAMGKYLEQVDSKFIETRQEMIKRPIAPLEAELS